MRKIVRFIMIPALAAVITTAQCLSAAPLSFAESSGPDIEVVRSPEAAAEVLNDESCGSACADRRIMVCIPYAGDIETYGSESAAYYMNHYLLVYSSEEEASYAYAQLCRDHGDMHVIPDIPVRLESEKGWGTEYMKLDKKAEESEGAAVTVAVLDSGIDRDHEIFSGRSIEQGYDFINTDDVPEDEYFHGTAVAGIIAESTPSNVSLLPVRIADADGEGTIFTALYGLAYAEEQGADIINMSLGLSCGEEYFEKLKSMFSDMYKGKSVLVCASGNECEDMDTDGVYEFPGELEQTICVGAFDRNGVISGFSNYGSAVDFAAPGEDLSIAVPGNKYEVWSGTSFSAPYISAAAAVVMSESPGLSPESVKTRLAAMAEDMGEPGRDPYFGYGCPVFGGNYGDSQTSESADQASETVAHDDDTSTEEAEPVLVKSASRMTAKAKTVRLKYRKLRKKTQTVKASKAFTVRHAAGKVTYKKLSGNKKITINKKTGNIRIKKKLKRGTYTVRVRVRDPGSSKYKARSVTVRLRIRVY